MESTNHLTEEEQEELAMEIDARIAQLEGEGFKDIALLSLMVEYAGDYQRLMSCTRPARRVELMLRYKGLRKLTSLLAHMGY